MPMVKVADLLKHAPKLLEFYKEQDVLLQETLEKANRKVSCVRGCNHCCQMLTTIHVLEGVVLAEKTLKMPNWKSILMATYRASKAGEGIFDTKEYFRKLIRCPLWDEHSGDCMVYEVRPGPCRQFYVATPPELCDPRCNVEYKPVAMMDTTVFRQAAVHKLLSLTGTPLTSSLPLMLAWCMRELAEGGNKAFIAKWVKRLEQPEAWFAKALKSCME